MTDRQYVVPTPTAGGVPYQTPKQAPDYVRHYQPGVEDFIELPTQPVCELLERSLSITPDRAATVFFGQEMSYRELADKAMRAAEGLRQLGVGKGDRVAIVLPNCPQHLIAFYAIVRLGAIVVEHNPLYTTSEFEDLFADHGAKVAICLDRVIPRLEQMRADVRPQHIVAVNMLKAFPKAKQLALSLPIKKLRQTKAALTSGDAGTMSFEQLLKHEPLDPTTPYPSVHDLASIQYTSGTTGLPKGSMLTHFNLYSNAVQGKAWMHDAVEGQETSYAVLPFFHSFGVTVHMTFGVMMQMTQVLVPKPDVPMILDAMKKHPATVYCAVPIIYDRTAEGAAERGLSLTTIKYCISGSMALPESTRIKWEQVTSGRVVEGYGLTEASPVALGNPFAESRRPGTIGVPFPSTEMRVVDIEDGKSDVEQGKEGELLLRGPQIFQGYWNNPEATKQVLDDGWLHTGDVVVVDEDGFTKIVDRKKEIIITGGFNVSPTEVEYVLAEHDEVEEVAVFGVPREAGDERVAAAIVTKSGGEIDRETLRAFAKEKLTGYKVPRYFVFVDELPRNGMGKILRGEVRKLYADQVS
mgnify:CR=1 FL=1